MPRRRRGWAFHGEGESLSSHTPLTVSLLEPALLFLIHEQARHGYTMLQDLNQLGMGTIHPSVVYRTLRDMEVLTWIASDWDTNQTQGPPRRTYRITQTGEEALRNWKRELVHAQDMIARLLERAVS
ncbi:MAG: helix-turn-helix transcriptional regulator [Anaerolineaceae bacterium]|nr:helix-turn-helix transcriptional regulator [Anaerolineaceae bacterium]